MNIILLIRESEACRSGQEVLNIELSVLECIVKLCSISTPRDFFYNSQTTDMTVTNHLYSYSSPLQIAMASDQRFHRLPSPTVKYSPCRPQGKYLVWGQHYSLNSSSPPTNPPYPLLPPLTPLTPLTTSYPPPPPPPPPSQLFRWQKNLILRELC